MEKFLPYMLRRPSKEASGPTAGSAQAATNVAASPPPVAQNLAMRAEVRAVSACEKQTSRRCRISRVRSTACRCCRSLRTEQTSLKLFRDPWRCGHQINLEAHVD